MGKKEVLGKKEDQEQWGRIRVVLIHKHMTVANNSNPAFLRVKLDFMLAISYLQLFCSEC